MLNHPGTSSGQLLQYMDVPLEGNQVDTPVIQIGVNDFLNDNSQSKVVRNIKRMTEKYRCYDVQEHEAILFEEKIWFFL